MRYTRKQLIALFAIGLLIANIVLLAIQRIDWLQFWFILLLIAVFTYFVMPKMK